MQHGVIIKKTYVKKYVEAHIVTMIATTAKSGFNQYVAKLQMFLIIRFSN